MSMFLFSSPIRREFDGLLHPVPGLDAVLPE